MKLLSALLLFLSCNVFAQKQLVVDANAEVRPLDGPFNSIKLSSGIHLYISQGNTESLAVSASDDKEDIKTEVKNNELHIYSAGHQRFFNKNNKVNVYVSFKNLEQLVISGASDAIIAGVLDLPLLNANLSGASVLHGAVNIKEFNVRLSGASDAKLSGTTGVMNIESSGASDVKGFDLTAQTCNVKVSGAGDVNITVNGTISASASGASNVYYKGPGELKVKQSSGASSIARAD